jgi:hypothetical protein
LSHGEEHAGRHLPAFKLEMTSEQIAEAERLVREFKPRKTPEPGPAVHRASRLSLEHTSMTTRNNRSL